MPIRARRLSLLAAVAILSATTVVLTAETGTAAVPPGWITITSSSGDPNRTGDNVSTEAHDGSLATGTYTTPSNNTQLPSYLQFFFASTTVNRLRIYKDAEYGPHDLAIQTINSADALPAWANVSGLINGFAGTELLTATSVSTSGTVTGDAHVSGTSGFASLTFDPVVATGLRIAFTTAHPNVHYHVFELELYYNLEPAITSAASRTFNERVAEAFIITTTGAPTVDQIGLTSGTLPTGLSFVNNFDGTAKIGGKPAAGTAGSYPLEITAGNGVGDPAVQNFTLTVAPAPVVGVVQPNGGESWARGVPHLIKWFKANASDTRVRIVLLKAGTPVATIASSRPTSDGQFSWTPSNSLTPGTNYKIRIVVNWSTINDVSNANFALT